MMPSMAKFRLVVVNAKLPSGMDHLRMEAATEGFRFLDRLIMEWESGVNRFDREGECLLGLHDDSGLAAIGGLNRCPYTDQAEIGRIRRLFVSRSSRRFGLGRILVGEILKRARKSFREVRLTTDTESAAAFYRACGFSHINEPTASHALVLASHE